MPGMLAQLVPHASAAASQFGRALPPALRAHDRGDRAELAALLAPVERVALRTQRLVGRSLDRLGLDAQDVGQVLMMYAGARHGLAGALAIVEDVRDRLPHGGRDPRAA